VVLCIRPLNERAFCFEVERGGETLQVGVIQNGVPFIAFSWIWACQVDASPRVNVALHC